MPRYFVTTMFCIAAARLGSHLLVHSSWF